MLSWLRSNAGTEPCGAGPADRSAIVNAPKNILLVRTDRIGDVVLSLPCVVFLKRAIPGVKVTFLAREYTAPLVRMSPDVDDVLADDTTDSARRLATKLRSSRFDAAVLLHPTAVSYTHLTLPTTPYV